MKLYEIDREIESLVDPATGEILDFEAFSALQMERETKIENMALWSKNLTAEADAIKTEKNALAEREKTTRNKADSLKRYLSQLLSGEKFATPKVAVTFRKSSAVEIDDSFAEWAKANADHLLKFAEPTVDKTAVRDAIKSGAVLDGARLVESQNIQIK